MEGVFERAEEDRTKLSWTYLKKLDEIKRMRCEVKKMNEAMDRISMGNEFITFIFEKSNLGIQGINGFLEIPEQKATLWRVELKSKTGESLSLDNTTKCETSYTREGALLSLSWKGIDLPETRNALDVLVKVELPTSSRLSFWKITVENRSPNWGVWVVDFPYISGIKAEGTKLAYPHFLGRLVELPGDFPIKMTYPSSSATMQFSTIISGSEGLYLAAYDPECFYKEFLYETGVTYKMQNFPENMGSPGKDFTLPYEAVIGSFKGDWIDAAKIYRSWATKQKWCSKGRLHEREDVPLWFKDISVWYVGSPSEKMVKLREFIDVPTAFHWYNWHQIPFDKFYPDYFPPKEGFEDKIEELHAAKIKTMPYINARLWDTASNSWEIENPEPYTTKNYELEKQIEHWADQNHSVMCPYTEFWHRKVAEIVKTLVGKYKVDGVYLDQIASMLPLLCFDKNHGHPAGGGNYWVEGYRKLVEKTKKESREINPEAILTTEDHAEPFLDLFDGLLTCNSVFVADELIPLFNYVYSGYMITFGRYNGKAFTMKNAQMFIWGTQLGWFDASVLSVDSTEAQYLKDLAQAFSSARKFLLLGEMLRPPKIEGDNPKLSAVWREGKKPVEMPAVGCTTWKAPDGTLGLAFTNCDSKPHSIRYELDVTDYGLPMDARYRMRKIAGNLEEGESFHDKGKITKEHDFPRMSVLVLEIGPLL